MNYSNKNGEWEVKTVCPRCHVIMNYSNKNGRQYDFCQYCAR